MKKIIMLLLIFASVVILLNPINTSAATTYFKSSQKTVTVTDFDKALKKATGSEKGFISSSFGIKDTKKAITRLQAAQLVYNAYRYKEGKEVSKETKALYDQVVANASLKDATKIASANRKYARYAFVWGIMEGDKPNDYSKQRNFNASATLTGSEANTIVNRVADKKLRFSLTDDGQLIRTSNLPKNHKDFKYILANVPNKFYEIPYADKVSFSKGTVIKPKNVENTKVVRYDGESQKISEVEEGDLLEHYVEKVALNTKLRTNIDYKTIGDKWVKEVSKSYGTRNSTYLEKQKNDKLQEYVKFAKKNKITVKGTQVFTDESAVYSINGQVFVRLHVKVSVSIDNKSYKPVNDFGVYGIGILPSISFDTYFVKSFKQNNTYTFIMDIPLVPQEHTLDPFNYDINVDSLDNGLVDDLQRHLDTFK